MKISVIIEKVHGALAQLGARHTGSVEVTGSNPVCSIFYYTKINLRDIDTHS